ncbi:MAG: hypothetical protein GY722_27825 [bacterium]|nr:hypothetical protein [bacterium]
MSALGSKKIFAPLFVVLVLLVSFLTARSPRKVAAASGSSILAVHDDTLTNYRAAATGVQDISPLVIQRGVGIDGAVRAGSTHPMHLAGNPFGSPWSANQTLNGLQTATGSFAPTDVDISLPAQGPAWVIGRSYNSRQEASSSHHDSDGYQGKNWFQMSQPEIVLYEGASDTEDVLYLVYGADRYIEFNRSGTGSEFCGVNGAAGVVEFEEDGSGPDTYTYYDQWGYRFIFFGFDGDAGSAKGQIWKIIDPGDLSAYVGHATNKDIAIIGQVSPNIDPGYDSSGRILKAYDSEGRRFSYDYPPGVGRLAEVKAETKTGGTWGGTPTGVNEVAKVEYEYYTNESHGNAGDLKLVEITTPLSDPGLDSIRKRYYRYWDHDSSGYHFSTNPGYPHQLRMVLDPEGTRRQDWAVDSDFDEDFRTETTDNLKSYASIHIEYDSSRRAKSAFFNGACGCGSSSDGEHTFEYEGSGYTNDTGYDPEWATRVVIGKPEGVEHHPHTTQYFDEAGQSLHEAITDDDPGNTPDRWVTKVTRNSDGIITDIHTPANITGYTHAVESWAISTSTNEGLVRSFVLETTGQTKGFTLDQKYQTGTSGPAYLESTLTYETSSLGVDLETVVQPFVASRRVYTEAVTSGTSGSHLTDYEPTWYTGAASLMPKSVLTTQPAVTAANNGSDTANSSSAYFSKQGRQEWLEREDGTIDYWGHDGGRVTLAVSDALTTHADFNGLTLPSGLASDSGAVHRRTAVAYDAGGQTTVSVGPDTSVVNASRSYVSKLKDERLVVLKYAHYSASPHKYYGPVVAAVSNQAGAVEVQAVVALANDESSSVQSTHVDEDESDPLLAIDIGTVEQMSTTVYGDSGQELEKSRLYFDVPTSGAGADGTNYDETLYAYDDEGRQIRIEEPSGTLRRTTYDVLGRVASRLIGTNDFGYDEGDLLGPANMVTIELLEYDEGDDDGNGYLTKRTSRVQDSSTDERVTYYERDVRGNTYLVENPTAPHIYVLRDNLGRAIARAAYSSTTGLSAGFDPTLSTSGTNRLALSRFFYDEVGRVYKTQRHKIDTSDGSDDDEVVALTWYDERDRVIMVDGEELSKTFYDRLGRVTHRFTLAKIDSDEYGGGSYGTGPDGAYGYAKDVVDDHVLLERQTTYESSDSDDVIMEAAISRHHDDLSTGTEGALDTNADGLPLKYTAGDVKGRIQVRAMWYDDEGRGRAVEEADYGTNGGGSFEWISGEPPITRSGDVLVTSYAYDIDGTLQSVKNPRGKTAYYEYDDAGRMTVATHNYVDGTPPGSPGGNPELARAAEDVHTRTEYTDGLRTKVWVDWDGDGQEDAGSLPDQVTTYRYGTTKGTSPGDSMIATGHLLQEIEYPDSASATDVVTFAYSARGEQVYKRDQAGTVIETEYDDSGRREHQRVTAIDDNEFDDAVLRITTTYDDLGRPELVTQYDDETGGAVTDEVKYTYEGWGYVSKIQQDNNSAVAASGGDEYEVSYTYAKKQGAGRNTIRRVNFVAPSGNTFDHEYRATGNRFDDDCSRVTHIDDGATLLALYSYNGVGHVVGIDYSGIDIKMERFESGAYGRLDRFDRVQKDVWAAYGGSATNVYSLDIDYDENSNIVRADDHVHPTDFDVVYTIDGLDRLTNAREGDLDGNTTIQTESREQGWTLDQVGNWDHVTLDLNGDGDYEDAGEYDDDRSHNGVNEITARNTDNDGGAEHEPEYDDVGNLTNTDDEHQYVYDAFYRLREVNDQSGNPVAEHRYNGLGYRIAEHADTDDSGTLNSSDDWYHFCYDERWRVAAMFIESDTAPTEEFMPHGAGNSGFGGSSYVDQVAVRDRDTKGNGTLDERVFYCQNWRNDVIAIADADGGQAEMTRYSAYGVPFALAPGDMDSDGDVDAYDNGLAWGAMNGTYDVRGDIDLDGNVDSDDVAFVQANHVSGQGRGVLTGIGNRRGWAGYSWSPASDSYHVRNRVFSTELGEWSRRDPLGYRDGLDLYEYSASMPVVGRDPLGLTRQDGGYGGLSSAEVGYYAANPGEALVMRRMGAQAHDAITRATGRRNHRAGMLNALLHCVMSCRASMSLGNDKAFSLMNLHEFTDPGNDSRPSDGVKDLANNQVGRRCAKGLKPATKPKVATRLQYVVVYQVPDPKKDSDNCYDCCARSWLALAGPPAPAPVRPAPRPSTPGPELNPPNPSGPPVDGPRTPPPSGPGTPGMHWAYRGTVSWMPGPRYWLRNWIGNRTGALDAADTDIGQNR